MKISEVRDLVMGATGSLCVLQLKKVRVRVCEKRGRGRDRGRGRGW
jgi:hypothetical protein